MLMKTFFPTLYLVLQIALSFPWSISAVPDTSIAVSIAHLQEAFAGNCPSETNDETITCEDALPYINQAIQKYGLRTRGQRAAYIANMAYEGAYLRYNYNIVIRSQGTRSILPAVSLRTFVDANKDVQDLWPDYPMNVNETEIADVLVKANLDFEPGAWWTVSGPGCSRVASRLSDSNSSFVAWETTCINGGADTIVDRLAIYRNVYNALQ
ncbi:hypothetical protein BX616_007774 [Lobosporangium transversale]|uniref:Lysozyme-like domain-containing protein n=1 Tax=Lobosporangium transversale TaxID=64571 RepID=A0A1Y2GE66_9FUNG|nr:hypothetical protein BCR41DRAFT_388568 [Lobosporangium transversale]KAF9914682.1 hypothetical protein BX616_007774 [Lobosporangium transversale]ORZ08458.1 hypothetical protein BCR41DRAFT_388568 [Lobosporangium transversale]|eukprot:XP_021878386.1 hypothetical protein BCR41DRAFT_388568 [Lobosporangium transversale]